MRHYLKRLLTLHWTLTMFIMCASIFVFTATSVNLYFMLTANFRFLSEHGLTAIMHGGLVQLAELIGYCLIAAASYTIFRACEKILLDWLLK